MVSVIRVQVADTQLARSRFNRTGLLDQRGDGVTHDLVARVVTCRNTGFADFDFAFFVSIADQVTGMLEGVLGT